MKQQACLFWFCNEMLKLHDKIYTWRRAVGRDGEWTCFVFLVSSPVYCHNMSGHCSVLGCDGGGTCLWLDRIVFYSLFLPRLQGSVPIWYGTETWWLCDRGRWRMTSSSLSTSRWNTRYETPATLKPLIFFFKRDVPDKIDSVVHWRCQWPCLEWGLCSWNMSFILLFLVWL